MVGKLKKLKKLKKMKRKNIFRHIKIHIECMGNRYEVLKSVVKRFLRDINIMGNREVLKSVVKRFLRDIKIEINNMIRIHNFLYDFYGKKLTEPEIDPYGLDGLRSDVKTKFDPHSPLLHPFTKEEWEYFDEKFR